mgnify:CR=1 FL=1
MSKKDEKQGQGQQPQHFDRRRLDVAQTAQRLNISRRSVYRLIHSGELKAATFGPAKGFQVFEASIEKYEEQRANQELP